MPDTWNIFTKAIVGISILLGILVLSYTPAESKPVEPVFQTMEADIPPRMDFALIENSPGGSVEAFKQTRDMLKQQKVEVRVKGYCVSACTLFLGLEKICAYPNARFGFHSQFLMHPEVPGVRIYDSTQLNALRAEYPMDIQKWIDDNGGLKPDLIWLKGEELFKLIPECNK